MRWLALFRPGDWLVVALGLAFCVISGPLTWQNGAATKAVIKRSGEVFAELDLSRNRRLDVPGPLGITRIAVENPIMLGHVRRLFDIPAPSQTIQPWQFGHPETKATCLWLRSLPRLNPTHVVDGREARVHREPPGPERWRNRSRTYPGIAAAMAEQWGDA